MATAKEAVAYLRAALMDRVNACPDCEDGTVYVGEQEFPCPDCTWIRDLLRANGAKADAEAQP